MFDVEIEETKIQDLKIIHPKVWEDERGFFYESWRKEVFEKLGLFYDFVQDNHSSSTEKGTLRGIHFQKGSFAQAKLVRCIRGAVLDVAVDLRRNSPQFGQWVAVELSSENRKQMLIPRGFGHGFLTLTEEVEFLYKADNPYAPKEEGGILWNDPTLGIDWGTDKVILSEKDKKAPLLQEINWDFVF